MIRLSADQRYTLKAYGFLPVTFIKRVVLGRDAYFRQYFWNRWGHVRAAHDQAATNRNVLWVDAISGGEVTQLVSWCRSVRAALPNWQLVLSTNTRYSYEFAKAALPVDVVLDTPWDCRGPVRRALRAVRPKVLVCVENLTSPVLVQEAQRQGVVTMLISGLMSHEIHRHPMMARAVERRGFWALDWIGAKSPQDAEGFKAMGARPDSLVVTGNMKFDLDYLRVSDGEREALRGSLGLAPEEPVFLAGSLHPGEERLVIEAFQRARRWISGLRLVLAPRYQADVPAMEQALIAAGLMGVRKRALDARTAAEGRVILVDTFGELSRLYSVAAVIFLGGSTYRRNVIGLGQNLIEPLAQRVPIFFGPFMNLWSEIVEPLKSAWGGVEVTTAQALAAGIREVLRPESAAAAALARAADGILESHCDDVERNVELVLSRCGAVRAGARELHSASCGIGPTEQVRVST